MDLPADNLAAVDIHGQVEIKEHTRDWPRHPGDVPSPDLAGRICPVAGGWFAFGGRFGAAPMMLLPLCAQDAIET